MFMKRPGPNVDTMKTERSTTGSLETNWLIDQVPAMTEAAPGATTPEPNALATTSK